METEQCGRDELSYYLYTFNYDLNVYTFNVTIYIHLIFLICYEVLTLDIQSD